MNGIPESQMSEFAPDVIALIGTGAVKMIPLTQEKVAVVDADDYKRISQYKWQAKKNSKNHSYFYAIRHVWVNGRRSTIDMQREILNFSHGDGKFADHRNRNGLDNRRDNLREVRWSINIYNRGIQRNNKSGYRGVYWHKRIEKWVAQIGTNGIQKHIGYYYSPEAAAIAYDRESFRYYEDNAMLNFPDRRQE
jgi:hypothetical protein